jgi:hypothetical protein
MIYYGCLICSIHISRGNYQTTKSLHVVFQTPWFLNKHQTINSWTYFKLSVSLETLIIKARFCTVTRYWCSLQYCRFLQNFNYRNFFSGICGASAPLTQTPALQHQIFLKVSNSMYWQIGKVINICTGRQPNMFFVVWPVRTMWLAACMGPRRSLFSEHYVSVITAT